MSSIENKMLHLTYAGLVVLVTFTFTSLSVNAASHFLLLPPGLYFFFKSLKDPSFSFKKSWYALLALMLVCWASVWVNRDIIQNPWANFFKTKYFMMALLSYCSFYYLKKNYLTEKKVRILFSLFFLSTTVATLSGLIGLWYGFNPLKMKPPCHPTRACGLYGMYMTYGYGISLYMVLLAGIFLSRKKLARYLYNPLFFVSLGVNFIGLIFSFARGAWLGFLGAVPFYYFQKYKKKFLLAGFLSVLVLILSMGFSSKVREVFFEREGSNDHRLAFYETAFKAFQERPLLGYGYRNFEPHSQALKRKYGIRYDYYGSHAHSNPLEHLASTGLLGFLSFLAFAFLWLKETYKEPILFTFVIAFFLSGLVQYTFGDGENLFLILGVFSLF